MTSKISSKKVVVAGHICLDITPVFPVSSQIAISQLFTPGKLINVENAKINLGGSVANTGLAMAFFGADVQLMGKIGNDEFGEIVSRIVKAHGINQEMIVSETSHTSYSIVLAVPGHDRIFLHDPGANDTFTYDDLDMESIRHAAIFHLGYPPLMKQLYAKNGEELTRIFKAVAKSNVVTSLDLAAVDPNSPAGQADWQKILTNTLPYVDIFMPSVEELLFMLDRKKYDELVKTADGKELTILIEVERDVKPLADNALRMGAKVVIIKCGTPGLYFKVADEAKINFVEHKLGFDLSGWANQEGFEASYQPDYVISATGAGDVTIAAFLTSLLSEDSLETCLKYATAAGACCVEAYDSLSGLKTFDLLQQKMDLGWKKNN